MALEKVSDNVLLLNGSDIFTFQISIYTLKLDVEKVLLSGKISDNAFEKESDHGFLLMV